MAKSSWSAVLGISDGNEATGNGAGNFESDRSMVSIGDVYLRSRSGTLTSRTSLHGSMHDSLRLKNVNPENSDAFYPDSH